ncbi:hypothetical protein [Haloferula sp. BvORR071]|uniref:hypothetical protein n=1 Tax=Haloferula sp. BvORR071 TaxID=1396141 RepID=UPI002240F409|nr:hypothetical protein [Haloferula sp. BvORR071]
MKTSRLAALAAAVLATGVSAPCALLAQSTNPSIPVGTLSAYPVVVQPGTKPVLTWGINYPSVVQDYVKVVEPSGGGNDTYIEAKTKLYAKVRVLGAGVTVSSGNSFTFVPTEAQLAYNGSSYSRIFYGTNNNVNPSTIVWSRATSSNYVSSGQKLRFGGRYYYNNAWGPYFNSQSGTKNVRILVNGQTPPTTYPLYNAPTLESFLKPYLDATGKVRIGPMDCIVFMELTHTDSQINDQGYDLQDMVLLVTFEKP